MAPNIPDRWKDYKPVGKKIEGTRFIAFKVPLKEHIARNVENDIRLDGNILMKTIPNLGLIIDLTNTNRYYDPKIFQKEGVEHIKLMIPGHETPAKHLVDKFIKIVKEFMKNNPDNDKLIGVHCTHGVNRTGYLICNYMISQMTMEPNEALDRFANARGHKIERNNYIDALLKMLEETNNEHKTEINTRPRSGEGNNYSEVKESQERKINERSRSKERSRNYERSRSNERSRNYERSRRDSNRKDDKRQDRKCNNDKHLSRESNRRDTTIRAKRSQDNYASNRYNHNNKSLTRSPSPPPFFANNRSNCYSYRRTTDDNRLSDRPYYSKSSLPRNEEHLSNSQYIPYQQQPPPRLRLDYYNERSVNSSQHSNHHLTTLPPNEDHMQQHQQWPPPLQPPRLRLDYYNDRPVKDRQSNNRHMQRFTYVRKANNL